MDKQLNGSKVPVLFIYFKVYFFFLISDRFTCCWFLLTLLHASYPQVVYMVWNAVNDPLFGYLQDNSRVPCCSQRRLSILYGAPLYSLAFLLAWFPWRSYAPGDWLSGLHLTVALCAFDGMLTFVLLAQCALFAEISSHHQNRLRLIKYNQVGPSS